MQGNEKKMMSCSFMTDKERLEQKKYTFDFFYDVVIIKKSNIQVDVIQKSTIDEWCEKRVESHEPLTYLEKALR